MHHEKTINAKNVDSLKETKSGVSGGGIKKYEPLASRCL
jgi:hypothetical protein